MKARRNSLLSAYFRANFPKPEEFEEDRESEEPFSEDSREEAEFLVQSEPKKAKEKNPTPSAQRPVIRPSTPQRIQEEKIMEELRKRMEELEKSMAQKDKQINQLQKEVHIARQEADGAMATAHHAGAAASAITGRAEVRARAFIPKLVPYQSEKENIQLYVRRFENYAHSLHLDEEQQVHEFIAHGRGPIENIVLTKDLGSWTIKQLKDAVLARLSPNWDINRIEQELYKIQIELKDDPDAIMTKIEKILVKRDPEIEVRSLRQRQFNHFVRLIHVHEPMHTYVLNKLGSSENPDEALTWAKEYLKEKGNDLTYFRHLVQQGLKEAGVPTKQVETGIFPTDEPTNSATVSAPTTTSTPTPTVSATPAVATKTESTALQTTGACAQVTQEYMEQFVKRTDKLTQEQMNKRFNDLERLMKDLHVAGLPDFLKKKVEKAQSVQYKSNDSAPKNKTSNKERPKRNFEKNKKGGDKKYKKQYIEKESGEIVAQYTTDDSGDEDNKPE